MNHTHAAHVPDLSRYLLGAGVLDAADPHSRPWLDALEKVPRHLFVPQRAWATPQDDRPEHSIDQARDPDAWWTAVYTNTAIVTQRANGGAPLTDTTSSPTSSLSSPHVAVEFLQLLDLAPHHRVLEIGTGTGWTAAMLAQRVGDHHVTTIEVDQGVAAVASANLKEAGADPIVLVGDGTLGCPDRGPYDRIHVTCGIREIPHAWVQQTRPGGVIVLPWMPPSGAWGHQLRLDVLDDGTAMGMLGAGASYMLMRQPARLGPMDSRPIDVQVTESRLDPAAVTNALSKGFQVYLAGAAPEVAVYDHGWEHPRSDGVSVFTARAGDTQGDSWATAAGPYGRTEVQVTQGGGRRVWEEVERAFMAWLRAGRPTPERFGITVSPAGQYLWIDLPWRIVEVVGP
ncbi:methyltransferase domain-containing protein [Nonomuraea typhae]|uniref:methyltransferase domain-containing protein n=1 Tax=Nonomuraea typhae TaxID=2603600 RepID=UPI0012F8AA0B|nr:methyltransferase domain-containing protein [Nonomuraea typhae]